MALTTPLEIPSFPERPSFRRLPSMRGLFRGLFSNKFAMVASLFLILLAVAAIFAPWVAPHDPNAINIIDRLTPPVWQSGGATKYLLGTDELGRDILSRIIWGARTSVSIGLVVVAFSVVLGTAAGLLAGYLGGWVDTMFMRIVDIQFSFPSLLISLSVVLVLGASATSVIIALCIDGWLVYCRLTRGMVMTLKHTAFLEAARVVGNTPRRVMLRHALPNILSPLITLATLEFARVVLAESTISFLGLGVQPPVVSWGLMMNNGEDYLTVAWWLITFPGLTLTLTVLSANVVASWLRVVADPLQRRGSR
ncbi:MAG: ABC transporter permease [Candidatus Dormiibacterota bacterium]